MRQLVPVDNRRGDWPRLVANRANDHEVRITDLETLTFDGLVITPGATPSSPVEGQIYMDSTTHKLRVYDGTTWQNCW